jgi:integrase
VCRCRPDSSHRGPDAATTRGSASGVFIVALEAQYRATSRTHLTRRNPVAEVDLPPGERNEGIRFLDPDEVRALVAAAVDGAYAAIDRALYLAAAMTGLREGELVALR